MGTAISVALYPVVFFLLFSLPAYLIARLLHRFIKPGKLKDFLYKQRYTNANEKRRRELEAALEQLPSEERALAAYKASQRP